MTKKIGEWFGELWPYLAIAAFLAALIGYGMIGGGASSAKKTNGGGSGALQVVGENTFDFGEISMASGKVRNTFRIKNTGTGEAIVAKIYTSCMCTEATMILNGEKFGPYGMQGHGGFIPTIGKTIAAGEEAEVIAEFDPAAHGPAGVGRIARVVYIETGAEKPLELKFSAVVKP